MKYIIITILSTLLLAFAPVAVAQSVCENITIYKDGKTLTCVKCGDSVRCF